MTEVTPRPLKPEVELEPFFDRFYGLQSGYAYIATKHPTEKGDNGKNLWVQKFFLWPEEKTELLNTVITSMGEWEVYFCPALFTKPEAKKENFKGTYYLWTEFDGTLPETLGSVPEPSMKIQSSTEGHEHWYWRLTYWEDNPETIEKITRPLAYNLGADLSVWNCNKVLRPPATIHHESRRITFFKKNSEESYSIEAFASLPEPAGKLLAVDSLGELPPWQDVVYGYQWPPNISKLFRSSNWAQGGTIQLEDGKTNKGRSSALTALAGWAAEFTSMTDEEIYVLIAKKNKDWGKWTGHDKYVKERIISLINYVRRKNPKRETRGLDRAQVMSIIELIESDVQLDWLIEGFVERQGIGVISGPPGLGKTQFSLQLCMAMALGTDYLIWNPKEQIRSLFFSLEMGQAALKEIGVPMITSVLQGAENKEESRDKLHEFFHVVPINESADLTKEVNQGRFINYVEDVKPDIIFMDSLGAAILGELSDDVTINKTFNFIKQVINAFDVTVTFLHHNRKEQAANKKPKYLADLYGSQYIQSNATNVTGLWRAQDRPFTDPIEINCLKMRVAAEWDGFKVKRDPETLMFQRVNESLNKMGFPNRETNGKFKQGSNEDGGLSDTL